VPKKTHDRAIVVRLTSEAVVVDYRLEVDKDTASLELLDTFDKSEIGELNKENFYPTFLRVYGPILANNLTATLDGKPLTFTCVQHDHALLDHLRCDFRMVARWAPKPEEPHRFTFREGNYELEAGLVRLALTSSSAVTIREKKEPSESLKYRRPIDLRPGEEPRLREVSATFVSSPLAPEERAVLKPGPTQTPDEPTASTKTGKAEVPAGWKTAPVDGEGKSGSPDAVAASNPPHSDSLLLLLLDSRQGFLVLLLLAGLFGAAHALTPGHGKTLVAAYLVGEQGTAWHALLLGLVTTLTHTGAVLVLAALLPLLGPEMLGILPFVAGFLVVITGLWLFFCRLSGQADHVHLGGHGHHHHHHDHHHHHADAADHTHDEQGNVVPLGTKKRPVGGWGLVVLGISGGIVPCTDAILMLMFAISSRRLWLGLPLLLAFSAGLAVVLIVIGLLVVYARGFAASRWGNNRVVRSLPLVSAVLVTCLGLWVCYDTLHAGQAPPSPPSSASSP
jgi:ABC-type nickel/cobalt efflux system permease component RcnA